MNRADLDFWLKQRNISLNDVSPVCYLRGTLARTVKVLMKLILKLCWTKECIFPVSETS